MMKKLTSCNSSSEIDQTGDQVVRMSWYFQRTSDKVVRTSCCFQQTGDQVVQTSGSFSRTDDDSVRTSANIFERLTSGSKRYSVYEQKVVKVCFPIQGHNFAYICT